jgi:hypothetical protein
MGIIRTLRTRACLCGGACICGTLLPAADVHESLLPNDVTCMERPTPPTQDFGPPADCGEAPDEHSRNVFAQALAVVTGTGVVNVPMRTAIVVDAEDAAEWPDQRTPRTSLLSPYHGFDSAPTFLVSDWGRTVRREPG